jgi:hypothetical protein
MHGQIGTREDVERLRGSVAHRSDLIAASEPGSVEHFGSSPFVGL